MISLQSVVPAALALTASQALSSGAAPAAVSGLRGRVVLRGVVALAMLAPVLAGCGQKGPLVLPPAATAPAGAASAPAAPR